LVHREQHRSLYGLNRLGGLMQLARITERQGEAEFEWYALCHEDTDNKDILTQYFGDLDEQEVFGEKFMTSDWCSAVWVDNRRPIEDNEIATLKKFGIAMYVHPVLI